VASRAGEGGNGASRESSLADLPENEHDSRAGRARPLMAVKVGRVAPHLGFGRRSRLGVQVRSGRHRFGLAAKQGADCVARGSKGDLV